MKTTTSVLDAAQAMQCRQFLPTLHRLRYSASGVLVPLVKRVSMYPAAFMLAFFFASSALAWPATVNHVTDGDTLSVSRVSNGKPYKVRLTGLDAPETRHGSNRPGQPYGSSSTAALRSFLSAGQIDIRPDGSKSWGRINARVFVNGLDVGHALVRGGHAWRSPKYDRQKLYKADQQHAKENRAGLWSQSDPIAPWTWRHTRWR